MNQTQHQKEILARTEMKARKIRHAYQARETTRRTARKAHRIQVCKNILTITATTALHFIIITAIFSVLLLVYLFATA